MMDERYRFSQDYEQSAHLRDGTHVVLRLIRPSDKQQLLEGFKRLSADSRYKRFLASKNRLTDDELRYLTVVDGTDHFALVAVRRTALGKEEGLGVARFVRFADDPDMAEPAITVADDYQGKGLGSILLRNLIAAAWERGIRRFRCTVLIDNTRIRDLFADIGTDIRIEEIDDGAIEVTFPLQAPVAEEGTPLGPIARRLLSGVAEGLVSVLPARIAHEVSEPELERFVTQIERFAEETGADLRQTGLALRRRFGSLLDELRPAHPRTEEDPDRQGGLR